MAPAAANIDYRLIGEPECRLSILRESDHDKWDIIVGCVGYEERSSYAPSLLAPAAELKLASAFDVNQVLHFKSNMALLTRLGYEVEVQADAEVRGWLAKEIINFATPGELPAGDAVTVAVDVSSFSRSRIAQILLGLCDAGAERSVRVDLIYAPAKYRAPVDATEVITVAEPVAYEFAGWPPAPESPIVAAIGLGYEPGRAVGIAEYLDADWFLGFVPTGVAIEYDRSVETANTLFWVDPRARRVGYDVLDPFMTFVRLEALAYGLSGTHRVVLVPFGPKMFATCALLVGLLHPEAASVWRVSAGTPEEPIDQAALGVMTRLSLEIAPLLA